METDDEPKLEIESVTRVAERFGKYRSLGRIGQGGMADVFLAVGRGPAGFNKLVVIKRLRDNVASDDAFRDMFLDEARLAARLNHPNVVQTYEVFEDQGSYFITMEYLEGQPLGRVARECAKRGMRLEPRICARIVSDALCGLHYAHDACDYDGVPLQIVHRDVSPQNIFVTYAGQAKVVDFGIAKAERSNTKTQAGFFKGKAAYMAPEQLEGGPIDRRVDVFTTGIVLWELLSGKKLMAAESTAKTLMRLLRDPVPLLSEVIPNVDPALDRIVDRALQRDPAARYQNAGEMRDALEHYLVEGRHQARHEEIGRIVGDTFRDAREGLQRQISEHMAVASEYPPPRSGTMPAAVLPPGLDPLQSASMSGLSVSGLNVSRTIGSLQMPSSVMAPIPSLVEAGPKATRVPSWAVAALAAVSVALAFTVFERVHAGSGAMPVSPPAPAALPPPVATQIAAPPPIAPVPNEPPAAAEARPEPTPSLSTTPVVARPAQPAWRPSRAPSEPKALAGNRSGAAPAAAPPAAPPINAAPAPAAQAEPAPAAHAPSPPAAPPTPAPAATQEGRKFRTSL